MRKYLYIGFTSTFSVSRWTLRFETVRELFVCKWNEILLFFITKVTWYFCFSQGVNSIRGHASSLLVLWKCFRGEDNILISTSSNIYNTKWWRFISANWMYFLVKNKSVKLPFVTKKEKYLPIFACNKKKQLLFFVVACKYWEIFFFFSYKG